MPIFEIKAGDTSPDIEYQLTDGIGNPINLSAFQEVKFRMTSRIDSLQASTEDTGTPKVEVPDEANGIVVVRFPSTLSQGTYDAEFEVEYATEDIETFPNSDNIRISVQPSLES